MASQRPTRKKAGSSRNSNQKKKPWGIVFWVFFLIAVFGLFLFNRENIYRTLGEAELIKLPVPETATDGVLEPQINETTGPVILLPETVQPSSAINSQTPVTGTPANDVPAAGTANEPLASAPSAQTETSTQQESTSATSTPASNTASSATTAPVLRERSLYLITVDRDGTVLRTKVARNLPVTDSPLTDVLTSLLGGPTADEQRRGLISLIPEGTRIISVEVRGNTAYINLNEEFQFGIYGVEGYAAALRQVVWTATEFSNIRDVQILIEGRRVDYMAESIWIGSPINREML